MDGFGSLGLVFGERGEYIMKKKSSNWEMPAGKLKAVRDFLPSPEELAVPEDTIKITISVKKSSINFFKHEAHKHHTKYQRMIRELLDRYASKHQIA